MRFILGTIALIFISGIFWGSYNLGVFKPVLFTQEEVGPFYLVGKKHFGAYYEISPLITEIETWAQQNGISCLETFGLYTDDPAIVENERLRSFGGCLLTEVEWQKISTLKLPENFETTIFERKKFLVGKFDGSPWIGPYKVYSKANDIIASENQSEFFPVLEVYKTDRITIQTTYFFPI